MKIINPNQKSVKNKEENKGESFLRSFFDNFLIFGEKSQDVYPGAGSGSTGTGGVYVA